LVRPDGFFYAHILRKASSQTTQSKEPIKGAYVLNAGVWTQHYPPGSRNDEVLGSVKHELVIAEVVYCNPYWGLGVTINTFCDLQLGNFHHKHEMFNIKIFV